MYAGQRQDQEDPKAITTAGIEHDEDNMTGGSEQVESRVRPAALDTASHFVDVRGGAGTRLELQGP